jgi:hypothetical protein
MCGGRIDYNIFMGQRNDIVNFIQNKPLVFTACYTNFLLAVGNQLLYNFMTVFEVAKGK